MLLLVQAKQIKLIETDYNLFNGSVIYATLSLNRFTFNSRANYDSRNYTLFKDGYFSTKYLMLMNDAPVVKGVSINKDCYEIEYNNHSYSFIRNFRFDVALCFEYKLMDKNQNLGTVYSDISLINTLTTIDFNDQVSPELHMFCLWLFKRFMTLTSKGAP